MEIKLYIVTVIGPSFMSSVPVFLTGGFIEDSIAH